MLEADLKSTQLTPRQNEIVLIPYVLPTCQAVCLFGTVLVSVEIFMIAVVPAFERGWIAYECCR